AVEHGEPYDLINPRSGQVVGQLDARDVFHEIVERAHSTGEPGVIFIDRINATHPTPWLGDIESTNPCGEQPLLPYESCNLGSINLEVMLLERDGQLEIDWERLRKTIRTATHMLDNVIDANRYPIVEIADMTKSTRKIGLGVMGFARMLMALGIAYASNEGRALAEQVMSFIDFESKRESIELAKARGPFPAYQPDNRYHELWQARHHQPNKHPAADYLSLMADLKTHGIRNACTTTVAPTGTLSIIADTSGGVEPVFALAYKRFQADTEMPEVDGLFLQVAKRLGFYSERLMKAIEANDGSLGGLDEFDLPENVRAIFVTAHDICPRDHVLIQAAFQKYNDSATSKTINFAEDATVEDVETAYRLAYQTGCKGITVYRNNSRKYQPLSNSSAAAPSAASDRVADGQPEPAGGHHQPWQPRVRPEDLYGFTRCTVTGDGKLYTTINYDEQGIREVVTIVGRSGGTIFSLSEALGRMVSLSLQYNISVDEIANKLIGIRGANPHGFGYNQVLSIPDALGRVLKDAPRSLGPVLAKQPRHAAIGQHAPRMIGKEAVT
ncbi:MAG: adenosylcobalamin-dependent ribonucleoside-diphosphate reductase, partial [Cyanobacteria bacterium REEB65]|nr:adenosylcobalamin-dependent ribonucleoside-diphosphate reductase [Cyanobacteria bacterium REEB65]